MKGTIYLLLCAGLLLFSCTEDKDEKTFEFEVTQLEDEDLIERMPNYYREYFPGKKQTTKADDMVHGSLITSMDK